MTEAAWPAGVKAITLFTEDLSASKAFYAAFLDAVPSYEDAVSAVFLAGPTMVNLLAAEAVPELIAPAPMAPPAIRAVYTLAVDDVDAACAALRAQGIALLNGPMDRSWGIRTASLQDPSGHVWELAR